LFVTNCQDDSLCIAERNAGCNRHILRPTTIFNSPRLPSIYLRFACYPTSNSASGRDLPRYCIVSNPFGIRQLLATNDVCLPRESRTSRL
jgi:hypothetical protein